MPSPKGGTVNRPFTYSIIRDSIKEGKRWDRAGTARAGPPRKEEDLQEG